MSAKKGVLADGQRRAYDGSIDRVRAEVEARYAEELENAGLWQRMRLRRKIEQEIKKRMKKVAPKEGLY